MANATDPTVPPPTASQTLPSALLRIEAYPEGLGRDVELVETHISWVLLLERDVFKVRKPVNLGFLDFRTLEQRYADCLAEVSLNAPLAEDVYNGVVAIWLGADATLRVGGRVDGTVVDWAVHMRRLPESERADVMLARGQLTSDKIQAVATRIAQFHAAQPRQKAAEKFGTPAEILLNVEDNFSATEQTLRRYLNDAEASELVATQRRFLQAHRELIVARIAAGRVIETHGDLRLEHVYLAADGSIRVLDCVEFSQRFRCADVCADIAFLAMDLSRLGHPELAETLLAAYARVSGDYDFYPLVDFYQSYRAFVRGKIAAFIAEDESGEVSTRERAAREARRCFCLALAAERPDLVSPTLFAVGGVIATGKSTVASRLGRLLPAAVISTDLTRKQLAGLDPMNRLQDATWTGAYTREATERVYAEVLRRSGSVLGSGRSVVVDASFRTRAARLAARELAQLHGAAFRFVECTAPAEVCYARLAQRAQGPSVSDGRAEIYEAFRRSFESVDELSTEEHSVIDTSAPCDPDVDRILQSVPHWVTASV
jgi:aminoglycoside phosphotransferase family enzyme/predicted kinase